MNPKNREIEDSREREDEEYRQRRWEREREDYLNSADNEHDEMEDCYGWKLDYCDYLNGWRKGTVTIDCRDNPIKHSFYYRATL